MTATAAMDDVMQFLPLDKSWLMRLGLLDVLHDSSQTITFLAKQPAISADLVALSRASGAWRTGAAVDVGESGTLYRFLQFADWKERGNRTFIKHGTLKDRKIVDDPSIVRWSLGELLKLDNGTSQWASAAVLCGNNEPKPSPLPYKLALTYEALEHWKDTQEHGTSWKERRDETILNQTAAYVHWRETGVMKFAPEQAEDYCFARAFDLMTPAEGEARWPSLRQHESDRIEAMEIALNQDVVDSKDHRVVQAVAMRRGTDTTFAYPDVVSKSWPLFWDMMRVTS